MKRKAKEWQRKEKLAKQEQLQEMAKRVTETRIETLEGLLGMVNEGIVIDAPALVEMIQEVKAATTPVQVAVENAAKEPGEVGNGGD